MAGMFFPFLIGAGIIGVACLTCGKKKCNGCAPKNEVKKPKDGDPNPNGDGSTWSQFWQAYRFVGVKP